MPDSEYYTVNQRLTVRHFGQLIRETWKSCYRSSKVFSLFSFLILCPIFLIILFVFSFKKPKPTLYFPYPDKLDHISLESLPTNVYKELLPRIQFLESHDFRLQFLIKSDFIGNIFVYTLVFLDSSQSIWSGLNWAKVQTKNKKANETTQKTENVIGFNSRLIDGTILRTMASRNQFNIGVTILPYERYQQLPESSNDVDLLAAHRAQISQYFSTLSRFDAESLAAEILKYSQELFQVKLQNGENRRITQEEVAHILESELTIKESSI